MAVHWVLQFLNMEIGLATTHPYFLVHVDFYAALAFYYSNHKDKFWEEM